MNHELAVVTGLMSRQIRLHATPPCRPAHGSNFLEVPPTKQPHSFALSWPLVRQFSPVIWTGVHRDQPTPTDIISAFRTLKDSESRAIRQTLQRCDLKPSFHRLLFFQLLDLILRITRKLEALLDWRLETEQHEIQNHKQTPAKWHETTKAGMLRRGPLAFARPSEARIRHHLVQTQKIIDQACLRNQDDGT